MDEEQHEAFDLNSTDFEYAMNPGQQNYRRQTKEQATYGIWADSDSDDDQKASFSRGSKKPKYSEPINFVSGGIKKGNKIENPDGSVQEDEEIFEEQTISSKPTKIFRSAKREEAGAQVFAGMRSSTNQGMTETSSVAWTKNSVVMQMMQKMGFVHGKGLGANKQGIVEPIQAEVRKGRGAIGAYGREAKGPRFGETAADAQKRLAEFGESDEENVDEFKGQKRENWKKSNVGKQTQIRYKTLDEIVGDGNLGRFGGPLGGAQQSGIKVIDMTGPEQKVYNDLTDFNRRTRMVDAEMDSNRTNFDVPVLMQNLNTLLSLTEDEIRRSDREKKFLKDQSEVLEEESKRVEKELNEEKKEILKMENILEIIENFQKSFQRTASLERCRDLFRRLISDYPYEYKLYELDSIAISSVLPLLKAHFQQWDPLDPEQINYGKGVLEEWAELLKQSKSSLSSSSMFDHFKNDKNSLPAFDVCVWEGWMPSIRKASLNWNPRNNTPAMLHLVETWLPILPNWIVENLLEQILIPRIKEQVEIWEPSTDNVPIDSWLLPWQSVMGDRLLLVHPTIRQKLSKALRNWIPGDRSAIQCIRPWKGVFASGTMHSFLAMNIVPKLEKALQTIDIQNVEHFNYLELFDWMEMLSEDIICQMLTKNFFPRFYDHIYCRLSGPNVSLEHIGNYYKSWKGVLPPNIAIMPPIRNELVRALTIINHVQRGLSLTQVGSNTLPFQPPPPMGFPPPLSTAQFFQR